MTYDFRPSIRKSLEAGARISRNMAEIKSVLAAQIALTADNPNYEKFIIEHVRLYDLGGRMSRELLMPHLWGFSFDAVVARYTGDGSDQGPECILAEIGSDRSGYPVRIISAGPDTRCSNASSLRRTLADLFTAAGTLEALDTLATTDPSRVPPMRRPL